MTIPFQMAEPPQQVPESGPGVAGMRVLVASSHEVRRTAVIEQCKRWGLRSVEAGSGAEARQHLQRAVDEGDPFEAVLVERQLADTTAEELARWIRAQPEPLARTRIVVVAPWGLRGEVAHFREAGCDAYLVYPLREADLIATLAALRSLAGQRPPEIVTVHTLREKQAAADQELDRPLLGMRVLLVEDNAINQRVARRLLERLGCIVDMVSDGEEAVDAVGRARYDVVLMDCQLPRLDGFEATRRIRQLPGEAGRVPIVAMTAYAMKGDREKCLAAGMNGYLSKPVALEALREELARYWQKPEPGR